MKSMPLVPCKIHNRIPELRTIYRDPYVNMGLQLGNMPEQEYYCPSCELDKQTIKKNDLITTWNKKQENV